MEEPRWTDLTCVLENTFMKEELGLNEENCLTTSRLRIDLNQIESVRQSFDGAGNIEDKYCYIRTRSGGEHCIEKSFDHMCNSI